MAIREGVPRVTDAHPSVRTHSQQAELDDALAAIIASTKRVSRKLDLLKIARKLAVARRYLGSLQAVATAVGLSSEMLRQFSRVEALSSSVKSLIKEGALCSVDMADRISRLPAKDQLHVAENIVLGKLDSTDVRAILAYRKTAPSLSIQSVVNRVLSSKNVRAYVLECAAPKNVDETAVRSRLVSFFGTDCIRDIKSRGGTRQVVITDQGRRKLEEAAKTKHISKRKFLALILFGEGTT